MHRELSLLKRPLAQIFAAEILETKFIPSQVLCATCEDEPRFREMVERWIADEEVPSFPAFVSETEDNKKSRKRKYRAEAIEAEEALKEMGADTSKFINYYLSPEQPKIFLQKWKA